MFNYGPEFPTSFRCFYSWKIFYFYPEVLQATKIDSKGWTNTVKGEYLFSLKGHLFFYSEGPMIRVVEPTLTETRPNLDGNWDTRRIEVLWIKLSVAWRFAQNQLQQRNKVIMDESIRVANTSKSGQLQVRECQSQPGWHSPDYLGVSTPMWSEEWKGNKAMPRTLCPSK